MCVHFVAIKNVHIVFRFPLFPLMTSLFHVISLLFQFGGFWHGTLTMSVTKNSFRRIRFCSNSKKCFQEKRKKEYDNYYYGWRFYTHSIGMTYGFNRSHFSLSIWPIRLLYIFCFSCPSLFVILPIVIYAFAAWLVIYSLVFELSETSQK